MEKLDIGSAEISYEIYGQGETTIVIDTAISSCSAEWWHISKQLGEKYKVLVYDRAGYGGSSNSKLTRTSANIVSELKELLNKIHINEPIILVGHSQGGYYAAEFALRFPEKIKGVILLDPATPFDDEFKKSLTEVEYKNSGIDKTNSYKLGKTITSLGLGFLLKSLFLKSPPFYYHQFEKEASDYIINSLCKKSTYITALEEYKFTHDNEETKKLSEAIKNQPLNNIPLIIITHSSEVYVKELKEFANLDTAVAEKIENLWQNLMKRYLTLSAKSESIIARNSGHYIHLTDKEVLFNAIDKCINKVQ